MTDEVISIGSAHVAPSSLLWVSQTVRGAFPSRIILYGPIRTRFLQNGSHIVPVVLSTTGHGLPQVVARLRHDCLGRFPGPTVVKAALQDQVYVSSVAVRVPAGPRRMPTPCLLVDTVIAGIRYV